MRHLLVCAFTFGALMVSAFAADTPSRQSITLLLQFDGHRSEESIDVMKEELQGILEPTGLSFDFKLRSELAKTDFFSNLVVVTFKGQCLMGSMRTPAGEQGPYAITHVSDGDVLPFSEVECDRVRGAIRWVMTGSQLKRSAFILGRALGRVLAHEVYHDLGRTTQHGSRGVCKTFLSGEELIRDRLEMDPFDLEKIRVAMGTS
jgi:hypothetical protein